MSIAAEQQMRTYANRTLVEPFRKLVAATEEPFVQSILDLGIPQMAFGRTALLGNSAFVPRTHRAASASKAAANAIALSKALVAHEHIVPSALEDWEGGQLSLGMRLWHHGQSLGDRSQFTFIGRSHPQTAKQRKDIAGLTK